MPQYLQKRRRRWYAVLEIPKELRTTFRKPRFVESLKTESLTEAEYKVLCIVYEWKQQIAAAKNTSLQSEEDFLEDVKRVRIHAQKLKRAGVPAHEIQMGQEEIAEGKLVNAAAVVHEGKILFEEHIEEFLSTLLGSLF